MVQSKQIYTPIDCSFHDVILDRTTRGVKVNLEYKSGKTLNTIETIFKDVFTKSSEEFLVLDNGLTIRLDKIISVDGQRLQASENCHH